MARRKEGQQHGQKLIAQEIRKTPTGIVVIIEKKAEKERELVEELYTTISDYKLTILTYKREYARPLLLLLITLLLVAGDSGDS